MTRVGYNFVGGTLGAALGPTDTTITFASAPPFDTLSGDEYVPLVIDPAGTPEIVHLVDYTSGATTGTIERGSTVAAIEGSRGTSQESHADGASWIHAPLQSVAKAMRLWATTTDTATDFNTTTRKPVPWDDVRHRGLVSLDVAGETITADRSGPLEFIAQLAITNTDSLRANLSVRVVKNIGTASEEDLLGEGAMGYIRNAGDGHTESSIILHTVDPAAASGDTYQVVAERLANIGAVNLRGTGLSTLLVRET